MAVETSKTSVTIDTPRWGRVKVHRTRNRLDANCVSCGAAVNAYQGRMGTPTTPGAPLDVVVCEHEALVAGR